MSNAQLFRVLAKYYNFLNGTSVRATDLFPPFPRTDVDRIYALQADAKKDSAFVATLTDEETSALNSILETRWVDKPSKR